MRILFRSGLLMVFTGLMFFAVGSYAKDRVSQGDGAGSGRTNEVELVITARPGSDVHQWMSSRVHGVQPNVAFKFVIRERAVLGSSSSKTLGLITAEVKDAQSDVLEKSAPSSPASDSAVIGDTDSATFNCFDVRFDNSAATAKATFTWTRQYTRDANNDGKADADAAWVITGVTFANINYDQPSVCKAQ